MLTSRERLTRLFEGKDIDRIPIWLLAPYHRLGCYADIYNLSCYNRITDAIGKYCDTFDRRNVGTGFCYNSHCDIKHTQVKRLENGNIIDEVIINYKDWKFTKYVSTGVNGTKVKFFVEDASDLLRILELPFQPVQPQMEKYMEEKAELGDKGLMMIDIGDPLAALYKLMSVEDFAVSTAIDFDKLQIFLDEMYVRVYGLYKYLLERNIGEVFFIVGAEFAGPPLVSPEKFNEMSVRYVKGIVDLIRSYGKKSIVHYHGNLYKVLSGMKEIGPDGLHTIEAPPVGDCTIAQARQVLGDMVLIGNIQYDDLARREKHEIEDMVRHAIEEGKSGRFILSPTAGPYETVINEKMVENYLAFIDAGIRYGKL